MQVSVPGLVAQALPYLPIGDRREGSSQPHWETPGQGHAQGMRRDQEQNEGAGLSMELQKCIQGRDTGSQQHARGEWAVG